MVFFTYKAVQDELKRLGLPWTRTFLQPLENLGHIPRPANSLMFHRKNLGLSRQDMRLYTEDEIAEIVEIVKQYKAKNNVNNDTHSNS